MKPTDIRIHAEVRDVMQRANQLSMKFNHEYLGTEHLLGALLHDDTSAGRLLQDMGTNPRSLEKRLLGLLVPGTDMVTASRLPRTPRLVQAIESAAAVAEELGHPEVDSRHLLFGLAAGDGMAGELLQHAGVTAERLRGRIGGPGRSQAGDGGQAPAGNGAG
jgi:ATP-dependent Clp protease ATP-binding subunit ClpC